jgi:hypothetical protein
LVLDLRRIQVKSNDETMLDAKTYGKKIGLVMTVERIGKRIIINLFISSSLHKTCPVFSCSYVFLIAIHLTNSLQNLTGTFSEECAFLIPAMKAE